MRTNIKLIANLISNFVAKKIGINREEVVLSNETPVTFPGINIYTSGNLYSDENWSKVFIINSKWEVRELFPTVIETNYAQNANGSWVDACQFDDKEVLSSINNDDIFVVTDKGSDYEDNNRSEYEREVIIYKIDHKRVANFVNALNDKEIKRWAEWLTK